MGAVKLAAAKAYLRIAGDDEDALVDGLIAVAEAIGEAFVGQIFVARELADILPAGSGWRRLAAGPVQAVLGADGLPAEGAGFALAGDAYASRIDASGDGWLRVLEPGIAGRIRVRYRAGLAASADALPAALAQGIVRLVAHLYAHRDAEDDAGPPAAVAALWRPYRRVRLS